MTDVTGGFPMCEGMTKDERYLKPCARLGKRYHKGHRLCTNHKKFYTRYPNLLTLDLRLRPLLEGMA